MSFTVQEVAQLLKQAKENEKPYVFFTGAGCSISAGVPSATGLIEEIRTQFPIQVKNIDHVKDQYNYGKYMSALDKDERRRLLKPYIIQNKNINWAHIALACLMQAGYVDRVLTFNFDSILSRACNMLGLHPSIYDFATANPHLYHLINDPSIVHLHGQGTGFVQLNTEDETGEVHTQKLSNFIAATLNSNPSLFIGYSGNADAFFPLLEEKYSEQHRLIWTGTKEKLEDIESNSVKNFLKQNNNITHYIGNIYADDFLIELAKKLDCFPPELFLNLYNFLNTQLDHIQPYPLVDGLDVLSNLSSYLKEQATTSNLTINLYTAFIHKYQTKESTTGLSDEAIDEIMWAYDKQARLFINNQNFNEAFDLYASALKIHPKHIGCLINYTASHLFAYSAKNNESYLLKALEYSKIALLEYPEQTDIIRMCANSHLRLGMYTNDEELLITSKNLFEKTLNLDSEYDIDSNNYAIVLAELAKIRNDENLYIHSIEEYKILLSINPMSPEIHYNYISSLLGLYHLQNDKLLLDTALNSINIIIENEPNNTYNLACYYSIINEKELAKNNLLHAEQHNTLPYNAYSHLPKDKDLDNVRNEPWFIELLERLKAKEEAQEVA